MLRYLCVFAFLCSPVLANDPAPTPVQDLSVIVADKAVTGSGKRNDPFVFDSSTKCILKLTGASAAVAWDTEDCPTSSEVIDRLLIFSLAEPGTYVVYARFDNGSAKAWFEIKGANGPPQPVNALAAKLKAALTGPDAKADAVQFTAIVRGVADQIEANPPKVHKSLKALFTTTLGGTGWPAGKYPQLPDLWRSILPSVDETKEITQAELRELVAAMRLLQKTGESIANGK